MYVCVCECVRERVCVFESVCAYIHASVCVSVCLCMWWKRCCWVFVHGVHFSWTGGGSILCEHMGSASLLWKGMGKVFTLTLISCMLMYMISCSKNVGWRSLRYVPLAFVNYYSCWQQNVLVCKLKDCIHYLHGEGGSLGVSHLDLLPFPVYFSACLLCSYFHVAVSKCVMPVFLWQIVGTPYYMSPELVKGERLVNLFLILF